MIQLKAGIPRSQFNKGNKPNARSRMRRTSGKERSGLRFKRVFSDAKCAHSDESRMGACTAEITDDNGKIIFKQEDIEVPASWSELATKIAVSKYFYGDIEWDGSRKRRARDFGAATDPPGHAHHPD